MSNRRWFILLGFPRDFQTTKDPRNSIFVISILDFECSICLLLNIYHYTTCIRVPLTVDSALFIQLSLITMLYKRLFQRFKIQQASCTFNYHDNVSRSAASFAVTQLKVSTAAVLQNRTLLLRNAGRSWRRSHFVTSSTSRWTISGTTFSKTINIYVVELPWWVTVQVDVCTA